MAEARARSQFLQYTPRKVAMMAGQIRGKNADAALTILNFASRKAALPVLKTLNSAVANLNTKLGAQKVSPKQVKIVKCIVNQGPVLKRIHPGSMGRAMPFKKKMCHLLIEVKDF